MAVVTIGDTGLVRQRLDEILAGLNSQIQSIFGADFSVDPESPEGQMIGAFAEATSDLAQLVELVYLARSPASASGAALSRLVRLNSITRKPAVFSTATVTISGDSGTVIPAGSIVQSTSLPVTSWLTASDVTIPGAGTGSVDVQVVCSATGPVHAGAGTLGKIGTVISGWNGVTNAAAASPGQDEETDAALRIRRARSVAIGSQGIPDGLLGAILNIDGVISARVFENPLDVTDGLGLPPHSIQAVVAGGADSDIAEAIFLKRSMGVTMVGASTANVTDSQGKLQTMAWDRPAQVPIYVTVNLSGAVPTGTKNAIKAALVAAGDADLAIGGSVIWSALFGPVLGVVAGTGVSITSIWLGTAPSPTLQQDATIAVTSIASWDATNINVLP